MPEPDPLTQPESAVQEGGVKAKTKVSVEEYRSRRLQKEAAEVKERRDRESKRLLEEEQCQQRELMQARKAKQACLHKIEIQQAEIAQIKYEQEQLRLEEERVRKEQEANAKLLASQAQQAPEVLGSHTPCFDEHGQELDYHDDVFAITDNQQPGVQELE